MPKVGTILVVNFTDFELWTEFHLNENLDVNFFVGRLLATKRR